MSKKTLYPYQKQGIKDIIQKFKNGKKRVVYQLPTGGGKTITASSLIHLFHTHNKEKDILFFVHRTELLDQFKRTYEKQYPGSEVGVISAGVRMKRFDVLINVAMINTAMNRLKKDPNWFGNNVGLIIIDEAHNASFDKLFKYFPKTLTVGLTATPMRLSKRNPMNLVYNDIVTSVAIEELIEFGSLSPNKTFSIDNNVKYNKIRKTAGDYNAGAIFEEYSKAKHITNTVKAYEQISKGQKTIVFNSSIEHSDLVNRSFLASGYNSKHLDGATNKRERENILKWFSKTDDAILQNVGVLTMGFDEPSIISVIMNRPTLSLPLWLQCTGRGSRIYPGKEYFNIIDLGGNVDRLGDWSHNHDWEDIFLSAKQKINDGEGIAPIKTCPECFFIMPIQTMECPECGHEYIKEIEEDTEEVKLKLVADNFSKKVNLHKISNFVEKRGWNDFAGLHLLKDVLLRDIKNQNIAVDSNEFNSLKNKYFEEVENWCKINGKIYNDFIKNFALKILNDGLNKDNK